MRIKFSSTQSTQVTVRISDVGKAITAFSEARATRDIHAASVETQEQKKAAGPWICSRAVLSSRLSQGCICNHVKLESGSNIEEENKERNLWFALLINCGNRRTQFESVLAAKHITNRSIRTRQIPSGKQVGISRRGKVAQGGAPTCKPQTQNLTAAPERRSQSR